MNSSLPSSKPLRKAAWTSPVAICIRSDTASCSNITREDLLIVGLSVTRLPKVPPLRSGSMWPPTTRRALARQGVPGQAFRFPIALSRYAYRDGSMRSRGTSARTCLLVATSRTSSASCWMCSDHCFFSASKKRGRTSSGIWPHGISFSSCLALDLSVLAFLSMLTWFGSRAAP